MKILLVVAHPRSASLTHQAARVFISAVTQAGHEVELADLSAEGFDPVMMEEDEPDWGNPNKSYSLAVQQEMARVERNETTVMFFPVWWWSMPALLKGWIDRVWNNGWAYGDRTFPHKRVWMVGIAGVTQAQYQKRGFDKAIATQLDVGILQYCGVADSRVELFYGAIEDADHSKEILRLSAKLASEF